MVPIFRGTCRNMQRLGETSGDMLHEITTTKSLLATASRLQITGTSWLLDMFEAEAVDVLLICGDIFDNANSPNINTPLTQKTHW